MARNLENSTSGNSNIQEMGPRRSTRLNMTIGETAPPPLVSTMGTTTVATSVATRGEVHGAFTTARAMPSKATHGTKATARASHSHASHVEQSTSAAQPAPAKQPIPAKQPASVKQPAPAKQPAPVVSQVGSRPFQLSGPIVEPEVISQPFFTDLTFTNSNLVPGINHLPTTQGGTFLPSSSNLSGEQHLSRQVLELTNALAQQTTLVVQQTTLVNQLLQRTEIQRTPGEASRSKTRADEQPLQQRPGKQPLGQPQTEHSGSVHSRLGPRDSVYSRLSARRSVHSRLGPRANIHSRLGPHSDDQHKQPSRQNAHSRLGPQGALFTSHWSRQRDERREAITRFVSSSTSSLQRTLRMLKICLVHRSRSKDELSGKKNSLDRQAKTRGSQEFHSPNKNKFKRRYKDSSTNDCVISSATKWRMKRCDVI